MPAPHGNRNAAKEADERLTETLRIRLTWDDRAEMICAAGPRLVSEWAREVLIRAARRRRKQGKNL